MKSSRGGYVGVLGLIKQTYHVQRAYVTSHIMATRLNQLTVDFKFSRAHGGIKGLSIKHFATALVLSLFTFWLRETERDP